MNASHHPDRGPITAPSILSADFAKLAEELRIVDPERDWLHCDVMDGHFVPNLTFGPMMIAAVRRVVPRAFLDVHLMIEHPERLIDAFADVGADQITVHLEACEDPAALLAMIRGHGVKAGLAIKPGTEWEATRTLLHDLDLLLVMTVEPGFGGQSFMGDMLEKVTAARAWRERERARFLIEVDGGIAPATATRAAAAGADVFVAGHAVFGQSDPGAALADLRRAIGAVRAPRSG